MASPISIVKKDYSKSIRTYTIVTFIIGAVIVFYGYQQFSKLATVNAALASEQAQAVTLQESSDAFANDYDTMKKTFESANSNSLNALQAVYPSTENYTELTRQLDKYFLDTGTTADPLFTNDIRFSRPVIDEKKNYAVLPFTMSVTASKNSFAKLMRYIENSGDLESKTRLMEIRSISISFPSGQQAPLSTAPTKAKSSVYNLSLSMNAYFQKPVITSSAETPQQGI
jgi:hypothetical protein